MKKVKLVFVSSILLFIAALVFCWQSGRPQEKLAQVKYQYLQTQGLDEKSPFAVRPAKDGSYTIAIQPRSIISMLKIGMAAQAWQNRTGIKMHVVNHPVKAQQGTIVVKDVDSYLGKNHKYNVTLGSTRAKLGVANTATIRISEKANAECDGDIYKTALHEIGHALGVSHIKNDADVMCPESGNRQKISQRDIRIAKRNHQLLMQYR